MFTSLALIFLVGLSMGTICSKLKLPRIIGMLITGIVLGPFVLNMLDSSILSISADLRKLALVIILLKAGLSIDLSDLKKVGRPAILLCFIPASFEIIAYVLFAPAILGVNKIEAALMGSVLAAVSPAVVVPKMVDYIEMKYGTKKSIPQMIMAGASCDDIFVIVLFTTFLSMAQGKSAGIKGFLNIPTSIILGITIGAILGFLLNWFFEISHAKNNYIRNSMKVIIVLGFAFLLIATELWLGVKIAVSALLAIVSMASILKIKSSEFVSKRLAEKFGKLWLAAEVVLFVLVGAAVDIRYVFSPGILPVVLLIFIALISRSFGVVVSLLKTNLNWKERFFCILAYLPKATVQAAIGSVPLSVGLACGEKVLSVAVMSIIITAPLGALSMDCSYKKLLNKS